MCVCVCVCVMVTYEEKKWCFMSVHSYVEGAGMYVRVYSGQVQEMALNFVLCFVSCVLCNL